MRAVVYIDVLFFVNLIINLLLLLATSKLTGIKLSYRLLLGGFFGAIYSVVLFFPYFEVYYTLVFKLLFSGILLLVSFRFKSIVQFVKTLAVFYAVSFVFAGGVLAVFFFTDAGIFMGAMMSNGILYFNLPWKTLFFSCLGAYGVISLAVKVIGKKLSRKDLYIPLTISFDGKKVQAFALIDTGNDLHDPMTDLPVIIVELDVIKNLLPDTVYDYFKQSPDVLKLSESIGGTCLAMRIRLIPFSSLGSENGMLIGFKPDSIDIGEKSDISNVIIGIYEKTLSQDGLYQALVGPDIMI